MPSRWTMLEQELDRWARAGMVASFWWRDDDATEDSPALGRLLELAGGVGAPVALAVVPAPARPTLSRAFARDGIWALLHGYAHLNHAPPSAKKAELGPHRPNDVMLAELKDGLRRLRDLTPRALPVLVPPWNRISPALVPRLSGQGIRGLSGYGPRPSAQAAPDLALVNTHVDIIDWAHGRAFVGEDWALDLALAHLCRRRGGTVDRDEPTGLITHHLAHDEACWRFVRSFVGRTAGHPAACWLAADLVFAGLGREQPAAVGQGMGGA